MNFSLLKLKSNKRGFSLIEVVVSATIFIVAMFGVTALISLNIANAALLRNRLIAANLAQEGIEIVRNIRDNNFLAPDDPPVLWDQNLDEGDWRVDYASQNLTVLETNPPLYFHSGSGLYDYSSVDGTLSVFSRRINIEKINDNEIRAKSIVTWRERNKDMAPLEVEDHLFNWK